MLWFEVNSNHRQHSHSCPLSLQLGLICTNVQFLYRQEAGKTFSVSSQVLQNGFLEKISVSLQNIEEWKNNGHIPVKLYLSCVLCVSVLCRLPILEQQLRADQNHSVHSRHVVPLSGVLLLHSPVPERKPDPEVHQETQCHGSLWDTTAKYFMTALLLHCNIHSTECNCTLPAPSAVPKEPSILLLSHDWAFPVRRSKSCFIQLCVWFFLSIYHQFTTNIISLS